MTLTFVRDHLLALSWRLPWVRPPEQIGMYLRYVGERSDELRGAMSWAVRARLMRYGRLGGVRLYGWEFVEHLPKGSATDDPLDIFGTVGWKVRLER